MAMVTGRPEDFPKNKPGGGLSVDVELVAKGRGMRVLSFFHGLNSLGLATVKKPTKLAVEPVSASTPSAASTMPATSDESSVDVTASTSSDPGEKMGILKDTHTVNADASATCDDENNWLDNKRPRHEDASDDACGARKEKKTKMSPAGEPATEEATDQKKDKYAVVHGPEILKGKPVFTFGNYETYYGSRNEDSRWLVVEEKLTKWLTEGVVLDIGCNTGKLTAAIARSEAWPRSVLGVDVDANLIEKANSRNWLSNLEFRAENFLQKEKVEGEEYDLILCLSVMKWIQYQFGDHGVRRLFRKVHRKLKTGGMFCLEYQDLKSYKKKRHLTLTIRENVRQMQLLPDDFPSFVASLGFRQIEKIEPDKGFDRPIFLFIKE
eukprot:GEMP01044914.1.p1 GENE.GEMP01044914.1~~GEMP01044914.1.p1  ORF type:complete len:380 (+),score=84.58 GEMP01044914.1:34-1173(+)